MDHLEISIGAEWTLLYIFVFIEAELTQLDILIGAGVNVTSDLKSRQGEPWPDSMMRSLP